MNLDHYSFHDSMIVEVNETAAQQIDFVIDYCIDWEMNVFEKRILRFKDVVRYQIDEIPFAGRPTILKLVNLGKSKEKVGEGKHITEVLRYKVSIQTNAGNRTIEFSHCELITP